MAKGKKKEYCSKASPSAKASGRKKKKKGGGEQMNVNIVIFGRFCKQGGVCLRKKNQSPAKKKPRKKKGLGGDQKFKNHAHRPVGEGASEWGGVFDQS